MSLNPPPIASGWGTDVKSGPVQVWALWFENVWNSLTGSGSGSLTVSSATGAITSYTATYQFSKIGGTVTLFFDITITNAGTGAGDLNVTIPHTSTSIISGAAREIVATGYMCSCSGASGASTFGVRRYDNVTIIATNNRITGSVNYLA